ncbi:hypothetical protein J6590_050114 [Homalodisca vitripennis]|nr:hypothetical protein J6590_050114 [Homalodisca vitripennis]
MLTSFFASSSDYLLDLSISSAKKINTNDEDLAMEVSLLNNLVESSDYCSSISGAQWEPQRQRQAAGVSRELLPDNGYVTVQDGGGSALAYLVIGHKVQTPSPELATALSAAGSPGRGHCNRPFRRLTLPLCIVIMRNLVPSTVPFPPPPLYCLYILQHSMVFVRSDL